jgi:hypothetical protein
MLPSIREELSNMRKTFRRIGLFLDESRLMKTNSNERHWFSDSEILFSKICDTLDVAIFSDIFSDSEFHDFEKALDEDGLKDVTFSFAFRNEDGKCIAKECAARFVKMLQREKIQFDKVEAIDRILITFIFVADDQVATW